jgi:serine/threonine-protein kinase
MYMSPEQCSGARSVDHRADIYSLGCVLFRMLTGRPPFVARGTGELIALHLREVPPPPSSLVPGLAKEVDVLVLRCLEKDVTTRYQTMAEVMDAIGRINDPGVPRIDTDRRPRALPAFDQVTPSMARGETLPASDSVAVPTPAKTENADTPLVRARGSQGWRIAVALALVAAIGLVILRPWKRSASSTVPVNIDAAVDAAAATDAVELDASVPDAAAAPADAALPTDAARPRHEPRTPRDAGAKPLPPDARQRTMVDLDNDGIPDRR